MDGVLVKYYEILVCVLGNSFFYGRDKEKGKIFEIFLEIVYIVMDVKGFKKGLFELLLLEMY